MDGTRAARDVPLGAFGPLLAGEPPRANVLGWAGRVVRSLAGERRLLLVVDDAHLLDDASAALVHQVAGYGQVLATLRAGQPRPDAVTSLWKDELAVRVDLRPLTREQVDELLVAALGRVPGETCALLYRLSEGNPLYLRELARTLRLTEDGWRWREGTVLPDRLAELIAGRMGELGEDETAVLELTAFGEPVPLAALVAVAGWRAVETVEARGLVRVAPERSSPGAAGGGGAASAQEGADPGAGGAQGNDDPGTVGAQGDADPGGEMVWLGHPLYGEVIRGRCPRLRRRRRFGELAGAVGGDEVRAAVWRLESGTPGEPGPLVRACRLAWALHEYPLAVRLARAAVAGGGGSEAELMLGTVLLYAGRGEEADRLLAAALERPCDERTRTLLAVTRANTLNSMGRFAEASALLDEHEPACVRPENRQEFAIQRAGHLMMGRNDTEGASRLARWILADPASPAMAAQANMVHGWIHLFSGRPLDAAEFARRALASQEQWRDHVPVLLRTAYAVRAHAALITGDPDTYQVVVAEGHAALTEDGAWEVARYEERFVRGRLALLRGQVAEAVRLMSNPGTVNVPSGYAAIGHADLALAMAFGGDAEGAERAMAGTEGIEFPLLRCHVDMVRPWIAATSGELTRAVGLCLEVGDRAARIGLFSLEAIARHDAVRLGAARAVADRLAELVSLCQGEFVLIADAHARAAAGGDGRGLDEVASRFERRGMLLHAAEAAAQAAEAHRSAARPASSRASSARAAALAGRCEGARSPVLARLRGPGLTSRELEVALLASSGLSSREIAGRLVLSVRTVENHLQAVYQKLGVTRRGDLGPLL
ncbi:helix-turn-helix transcriptional regulator [Sphaerisporangium aureirubrum]|uniref:helix-turn-helix transcriptional regulator n=1 Tax=Sphaerisporangium aureirubrum TaxID=1544736 RepID=UPI00362B7482